MAQTGETWLKKTLRARLEKIGVIVKSNAVGPQSVPGWPDWFISSYQWSGWVELKWEERKLEPLQRKILHDLCVRRTPCCVIRGFESGLLQIRYDEALMQYMDPDPNVLVELLRKVWSGPITWSYLEGIRGT